MNQAKEQAIGLIERMPDDATTSDILDELCFVAQVERGLLDEAEGRTISHEEFKELLRRLSES